VIRGEVEYLKIFTAILNSRYFTVIYRKIFGSLAMQGGYVTVSPPQLRKMMFPSKQMLKRSVSSSHPRAQSFESIGEALGQMSYKLSELKRKRENRNSAKEPFEYLDKDVSFQSFKSAFSSELKRAKANSSVNSSHHDIDEISLRRSDGNWVLLVQLKLRDPNTNWKEWLKNEDKIRRRWEKVLTFTELNRTKAAYYSICFKGLEEFGNSSSIPGGYTRTVEEKLLELEVPVYNPDDVGQEFVNLVLDNISLDAEIREVDNLVDSLVCELYELEQEEKELVSKQVKDWL
jgi:hypothetical protein